MGGFYLFVIWQINREAEQARTKFVDGKKYNFEAALLMIEAQQVAADVRV